MPGLSNVNEGNSLKRGMPGWPCAPPIRGRRFPEAAAPPHSPSISRRYAPPRPDKSLNPRRKQTGLFTILRNPGEQLPSIPYDDLTTIGTLLLMQVAYWYRLRRVPIPFQRPNLF